MAEEDFGLVVCVEFQFSLIDIRPDLINEFVDLVLVAGVSREAVDVEDQHVFGGTIWPTEVFHDLWHPDFDPGVVLVNV